MLIALLSSVLIFAVGVSIGSFLHVLVYRTIEANEDWKTSRSRCDHCKKIIPWYDNIPLLSYIALRGKCRYCRKPIAISHFAMELLTGVLFVWWFWAGNAFFQLVGAPFSVLQPVFWLLVGVLTVVILVADTKYFIIPDWAVAILAAITLGYRLILVYSGVMQPSDFVNMITAAFLVTLLFWAIWAITGGRGLGFGDVKLVPVLALLVGWPQIVVALFVAVCTGAAVGVALIALKKAKRKQPIPFGPFLLFGTYVSLLWGTQLWSWYWTTLLGM